MGTLKRRQRPRLTTALFTTAKQGDPLSIHLRMKGWCMLHGSIIQSLQPRGLLGGAGGKKKKKKNLPAKAGDVRDAQHLVHGSGRYPGGGNTSPLQDSYLAGYGPQGCKHLDTTEQLNTHTHTHTKILPWNNKDEPGRPHTE